MYAAAASVDRQEDARSARLRWRGCLESPGCRVDADVAAYDHRPRSGRAQRGECGAAPRGARTWGAVSPAADELRREATDERHPRQPPTPIGMPLTGRIRSRRERGRRARVARRCARSCQPSPRLPFLARPSFVSAIKPTWRGIGRGLPARRLDVVSFPRAAVARCLRGRRMRGVLVETRWRCEGEEGFGMNDPRARMIFFLRDRHGSTSLHVKPPVMPHRLPNSN